MTTFARFIGIILLTRTRFATLRTELAVDAIRSAWFPIAVPMPPRMSVSHDNHLTFAMSWEILIRKLVAGERSDRSVVCVMSAPRRLFSIPAISKVAYSGYLVKDYIALYLIKKEPDPLWTILRRKFANNPSLYMPRYFLNIILPLRARR